MYRFILGGIFAVLCLLELVVHSSYSKIISSFSKNPQKFWGFLFYMMYEYLVKLIPRYFIFFPSKAESLIYYWLLVDNGSLYVGVSSSHITDLQCLISSLLYSWIPYILLEKIICVY